MALESVFTRFLEDSLANIQYLLNAWISIECLSDTLKGPQQTRESDLAPKGHFEFSQWHLVLSCKDVKCPALTFGHKNYFGQRNVGRYRVVSTLGEDVKNLSVFPSLCYSHSTHHENSPRQPLLPPPWSLNEKKTARKEKTWDPIQLSPAQPDLQAGYKGCWAQRFGGCLLGIVIMALPDWHTVQRWLVLLNTISPSSWKAVDTENEQHGAWNEHT